jgi:CRISPR-associated endonuclease/helicase Cas3
MKNLSNAAMQLWAKKSNNDPHWLPLFIHMIDSAELAKQLWNHWLSDGARQIIEQGISPRGFSEELFVFLAAAHDIGKATPVFQAKPSSFTPQDIDEEINDRLKYVGISLPVYSDFQFSKKTPHALATQLILESKGCHKNITSILGAHHGKPFDSHTISTQSINNYYKNYYIDKDNQHIWDNLWDELINFALHIAGFKSLSDLPIPNQSSQIILSGLLIMCDWIASNVNLFSYYGTDIPIAFHYDNNRIDFAWNKIDYLSSQWIPGNEWMSDSFFKSRFEFNPRKMQSALVDIASGINEPGILVLEAPMGLGKTEAALAAAEIFAYKTGRAGVFFALPTQATSDGIFPRILDWVRNLDDEVHTIRLAHSKDQFNEHYQALRNLADGYSAATHSDFIDNAVVIEWFKGPKKALLADFVVGTIDQLLMSALKHKHVMLRHLGLANKVVIIDECHAYDAYMSQYLDTALRYLGAYHVPVIVLSATLPIKKRQMLIDAYINARPNHQIQSDPLGLSSEIGDYTNSFVFDDISIYPVVTYTDNGDIKQSILPTVHASRTVYIKHISDQDLPSYLASALDRGGCAGIIVNTVERAQNFAEIFRKHFGNDAVLLIHSRFIAPDRAQKERKLLAELGKPCREVNRPELRIVIGTQVLEQSLDIDFDILITDLCPMDLLLQRIGRLHRHNQNPRPQKLSTPCCLVLGAEGIRFDSGASHIYGDCLLCRTKTLLPPVINLPQDIPVLVNKTYDTNYKIIDTPEYQKAEEEWNLLIEDKKRRAEAYRIPPPQQNATIIDWLNTDVSNTEGEAAVRDTPDSIEVLLLWQDSDGYLRFMPWINNSLRLPSHIVPDDNTARMIACQSVRLPPVLCTNWQIKNTIMELERINIDMIPSWQSSFWLKGSLCLILNNNFSTKLCGYSLKYDKEDGLILCKEE